MISLKKGVCVNGLQPEILLGIIIVKDVFNKHGIDLVITSALDSKHMLNSKHYIGQAVDIRNRHIDQKLLPVIANECKLVLGKDYDLVLEKDHIHLEFDPKV